MKTKDIPTRLDPAAAFPDESAPPTDADLAAALDATAAAKIGEIVARLRAARPKVTTEWKYSDRSGWYRLHLLKDRRLFYLVPKRGDFRVSLILGGKAVDHLKRGPLARRVNTLLKTAKHYPEGTAFSFNQESLDPDLLAAFLEAKLAH